MSYSRPVRTLPSRDQKDLSASEDVGFYNILSMYFEMNAISIHNLQPLALCTQSYCFRFRITLFNFVSKYHHALTLRPFSFGSSPGYESLDIASVYSSEMRMNESSLDCQESVHTGSTYMYCSSFITLTSRTKYCPGPSPPPLPVSPQYNSCQPLPFSFPTKLRAVPTNHTSGPTSSLRSSSKTLSTPFTTARLLLMVV